MSAFCFCLQRFVPFLGSHSMRADSGSCLSAHDCLVTAVGALISDDGFRVTP